MRVLGIESRSCYRRRFLTGTGVDPRLHGEANVLTVAAASTPVEEAAPGRLADCHPGILNRSPDVRQKLDSLQVIPDCSKHLEQLHTFRNAE